MAAELHEVVVTAKESQGTVTASRIDRSAMEFLQPTSLSDLMQLLPGGQQKDPDLSAANTIGLRETGTMDAQGNSSVNNNYAISSLGTLFVVDGNPVDRCQYAIHTFVVNTINHHDIVDRKQPQHHQPWC